MWNEAPDEIRPSRLAIALSLVLTLGACEGAPDGDAEDVRIASDTTATADTGSISIEGVGFDTPESVIHDAESDVYLVSNIGGDPIAKANNGFISRVAPSGEVLELRWIAGGEGGITLHAPKGLALKGDSLFVTDIDSLRIFDRRTGDALGAWGAEGAGFLNDPDVAPDGSIYVSDTGFRAGAQGMEPAGTDAIFRFAPDGSATQLASGADLQNPNGVVVDGSSVIVVPFGGTQAFRLDAATGERTAVADLPSDQLDGVVRTADGTLFISSWGGQTVYRVDAAGSVSEVGMGISSPADMGYDATRGRLMIPVFTENRVVFLGIR